MVESTNIRFLTLTGPPRRSRRSLNPTGFNLEILFPQPRRSRVRRVERVKFSREKLGGGSPDDHAGKKESTAKSHPEDHRRSSRPDRGNGFSGFEQLGSGPLHT